jgi:serine/threonine protein kinase
VHIIDIYETLDNLIIIFELQQSKNSVVDVHKFLYDLIEGINYLHSNGILHRNIRIENIINDSENNNFKISNFSLSRTFFPSETFKDDLPFGIYTSPEIIEGKIYNSSCDLWSYGIICYCLIEGKFPFQEENKDTMIMNINEFLSKVLGKVTEFWKNQNKLYEKILAKTLIKSIFSRPSSEEIIKLFNDCKITTNN